MGWLIDGVLYFLAAFGLLTLITIMGMFVTALRRQLGIRTPEDEQ